MKKASYIWTLVIETFAVLVFNIKVNRGLAVSCFLLRLFFWRLYWSWDSCRQLSYSQLEVKKKRVKYWSFNFGGFQFLWLSHFLKWNLIFLSIYCLSCVSFLFDFQSWWSLDVLFIFYDRKIIIISEFPLVFGGLVCLVWFWVLQHTDKKIINRVKVVEDLHRENDISLNCNKTTGGLFHLRAAIHFIVTTNDV